MDDPLSVFHELGDQTRLRVLACIVRGRKNVSTIVAELGFSQPQVSYHLRKLREAGLAVEEKDGRWVWYEANHDAAEPHLREVIEYVARWAPQGDAPVETGEPPARGGGGRRDPGPPESPRLPDDMEDYLL